MTIPIVDTLSRVKGRDWQEQHVNRRFNSGKDIEDSDRSFLRFLLASVGNSVTDDQASVDQLQASTVSLASQSCY